MSALAVAVVVLVQSSAKNAAGSSAPVTKWRPAKASFKPDKVQLSSCTDSKYTCLEQSFGNIAYYQGAQPALKLFAKKITQNSAIEADCHRIGHAIGAGALMHNKGDVGKTFADGAATCWSGYYHGILERAFYGVPDDKLGSVAGRLCTSPQVRITQFLHYQCVHGIGHGLMIYTGYELPASLKVCEGLKDSWESTACDSGIFMENINSVYGVRSKYLKKDDLIYPCNAVAERHKMYCYMMVTSRILQLNNYDWKKTAAICATKAEPNWVSTCFQSYGRDASGSTVENPRKIQRLCAIAGKVGQSDCIYGAARDMSSNFHSGKQASVMCALSPPALMARCFNGVGTIIGDLNNTDAGRGAACKAASVRFYDDCMTGSGAVVR